MSLNEKVLIDNEPELRKGLKEVVEYLREASAQLQNGDVVELDGLDEKVDLLCMAAEKSKPQIARSLEPLMADMIAELEVLALHLKEEDLIMQNMDFEDEEE